MTRFKLLSAAALLAFATAAAAGDKPAGGHGAHDHGAHGHGAHQARGALPEAASALEAYRAANEKMHREMGVGLTGDPDADFVRGMIPHHQGAVDMARILLQYGKDPELRQLAEEIIAAQEKEIELMQAWLARNGK